MTDIYEDVPTFVAVVEFGGFAAAARHLNLSRSAVGKAIAKLELRLGAQLLQRTTRRVTLTDDGQAFHEHCQRALAELQAGRSRLELGRREISGVLRVSMPILYGRLKVAPVLVGLRCDIMRLPWNWISATGWSTCCATRSTLQCGWAGSMQWPA